MKRFTLLQPAIVLLVSTVLAGCSKNGSNPKPQNNGSGVTITSLDVNTGPYNTLVTITGTGFDENYKNDSVFFNGKAAAIGLVTSTRIQAQVPLAAGTGNVAVKVNGVKATGPVFTYQQALVVITFAGNEDQPGSANGPGTLALFNQLAGMAIDKNGNLYAGDLDNFVIRKITPQGVVSTFAGSGKQGHTDGPGATASFTSPTGLAVDQAGNVFVADGSDNLIRKITPDGTVSTIAGSGSTDANDGVGKSADFDNPFGVAADANDNLYVADSFNHEIRKITANGTVTTIAGHYLLSGTTDGIGSAASFTSPTGIVVGTDGNLYVTDSYQGPVRKITLPNIVTSIGGSGLTQPQGIATDAAGNLYVACSGSKLIVKIAPDGTTTTIAGSAQSSYVADGVVSKATFAGPVGIAVDASGNIFVSDNYAIREITFQ